MKLNRVNFP